MLLLRERLFACLNEEDFLLNQYWSISMPLSNGEAGEMSGGANTNALGMATRDDQEQNG
jgi:hypothetical protein